MQNVLATILEESVNAPSGENAQPWKFSIHNNVISVINIPEADLSMYNSQQKASYFAHGALIENITINASHHGYTTDVSLFPDQGQPNLVATITCAHGDDVSPDSLQPYISKRSTNRNHYSSKITDDEKEKLLASITSNHRGYCKFVTEKEVVRRLAKTISINEKIIFEDRKIHEHFYKHLIWKEEDQDVRAGFYIKTIETSPLKILSMKMMGHWEALSFLNKFFKISSIIATIFEMKNAKSGSFGIITIQGTSSRDYVEAGRVAERIWLTATSLNIAMQPVAGVLYCMKKIEDETTSPFSKNHTAAITKTYAEISELFEERNNIVMLFRIGHAKKPKFIATKRKPTILNAINEKV